MGLFWKRKSGDQFVSLRLNEPLPEKAPEQTYGTADNTAGGAATSSATAAREEHGAETSQPTSSAAVSVIEPVPTGAGPTPVPGEPLVPRTPIGESRPQTPTRQAEVTRPPVTSQKPAAPVPSR